MGKVGLAEALSMLREELARAQDDGTGPQLRFEITEAEVEFLVEVDAKGDGETTGNIRVIAVEAGGKITPSNGHRLRLKLLVKEAATGDQNLEVTTAVAGPSSGWAPGRPPGIRQRYP